MEDPGMIRFTLRPGMRNLVTSQDADSFMLAVLPNLTVAPLKTNMTLENPHFQ